MKHRNKIIGIFIVVILTIFFLLKDKKKNMDFKTSGRYTVGYVKKIFGMKGGIACEYEILVNGRLYNQSNYLRGSNPKKEKYFVVFNPKNPADNLIFLEIPVPDSLINEIPKNGWERIPIEYEQKLYEQEFE
ncbi:hypothetical protein [Mesonia sp. K4-1]|uniref:hypothetical protein n=1 Tax=Mesonia sp. K4-1 TaxID=2602760 RepID=UPI0011C86E21|nr:hypothetical protein [Mesonia sp. K4-1]TXK77155.1 hypothetical protein FT986_05040 [Mesonia sp. K4-1]